MNRFRIEFCTEIFLGEMRRRFTSMNPEAGANPVGRLEKYSMEHRSAVLAAVEKAIQAAGVDYEAHFAKWLEQKKAAEAEAVQ